MDFVLILIPVLLILSSQVLVNSTYKKYHLYKTKSGMTGHDIAEKILNNNGVNDVKIEETAGSLTDHFDPRKKAVRLSSEVYHGNSIAATAIAAHECGHVLQKKNKYLPLVIRNAIVPFINLVSYIGYIVLIIGILASIFNVALWGIILLSVTLVFQLITLPVEFNASNRAMKILNSEHLIESSESSRVKLMLSAAAFTYVASLLANLLEILRLFLSINRHRD